MIINYKKSLCLAITTLALFSRVEISQAQVAVTLGAQTYYDDNIYLENGKDRPAPVTFNDQLGTTTTNSYRALKNFDGQKDNDFITNLYSQFSGKGGPFQKAIDTNYNLKVGTILFVDNVDQDRLTLDGQMTNSLSKNVLPQPYYLTLRNAVQSNSNNLAVASGTATQSTQNYMINVDTGVRSVNLSKTTTWDLGYTGGYQIFLGQFYLSKDYSTANTSQQGTDFHSHTAQTAVNEQLTKSWQIGAMASGGVQMFTKIHEGAYASSVQKPEDLDRTNGQLQGTTKYVLTKKMSFNGTGGLAYSKLNKKPAATTITVINEDGTTTDVVKEAKDANTGLTYTASLDYALRPGSLVTLGSTQGFSTNLDGSRYLTRVVFANLVETITNELQLTLGSRYIQFEDQSKARPDTGRFEGSISMNYHLTESVSLNWGYNYANQKADNTALAEDLRYNSPEYQSNRFFVGITGGFVGLPL